jgi:hypothetical protein
MEYIIEKAILIGLVSKGAITFRDCLEMTPAILKFTIGKSMELGKKLQIFEDK